MILFSLVAAIVAQEADQASIRRISSLSAPIFENEGPQTIHAGYVRLAWSPSYRQSEGMQFELQQAGSQSFSDAKLRYSGPDRATFISGLPNGRFFYRVRASKGGRPGPWSEVLVVQVEHHSQKMAWTLFGLGFFVFAATATVVYAGTRSVQREDTASA